MMTTIKAAANGKCAWVMEVKDHGRVIRTTNGKFHCYVPNNEDVIDYLEKQQVYSGINSSRMAGWYKRAVEVYRDYLETLKTYKTLVTRVVNFTCPYKPSAVGTDVCGVQVVISRVEETGETRCWYSNLITDRNGNMHTGRDVTYSVEQALKRIESIYEQKGKPGIAISDETHVTEI